MKKYTTVAVIAALTLATQAFAMGGSTKGGQATHATTMKTGATMKTGTPVMTSTSIMTGTGSMTTGTGMTKPLMTPVTPLQPVAAK